MSVQIINKSIFQPITTEKKIALVHIVNDLGRWGKGFTAALDRHIPHLRKEYMDAALKDQRFKLNFVIQHTPAEFNGVEFHPFSMVAQRGLPTRMRRKVVDYTAIEVCLLRLLHLIPEDITEIVMPKIGSGLGGGKWDTIYKIILDTFENTKFNVKIYCI